MVNPPSISARMVSVELGGALVHMAYTGKLLDQACNYGAVKRGASRLHSSTVSQPHGGSGPLLQPRNAHGVTGNGRAFSGRIGRSGRPTVRACYKKLVSGQSDKAS